MTITKKALQDFKNKLEALKVYLENNPLPALESNDLTAPKKNVNELQDFKNKLEALKVYLENNQLPALESNDLTAPKKNVNELGKQLLTTQEIDLLDIKELIIKSTTNVTDAINLTIEKIDSCAELDDNKFTLIGKDLKAFFSNTLDALTKFAHYAKNLSHANFLALGSIDNIKKLDKALNHLKPDALVETFNESAKDHNLQSAKAQFITALKGNELGLGDILSTNAKANEEVLDNKSKFQKDFDDAAGKLFDSFARITKKDAEGKFGAHSLVLDPENKQAIWEATKAFVGGLVKHALIIPAVLEYMGVGKDFLQSDRAKRNEARKEAGQFEKLLGNTDARNQLLSNEAKNIAAFRG